MKNPKVDPESSKEAEKQNAAKFTCLKGLLHSLGWNAATRDDEKIIKAIEEGEAVDEIYNLNEAALLDPFFEFLEEASIFPCLKDVSIEAYQRIMVPVVLLLLTYMTKILVGIPSMNALPDLLFSNQSIMRFLGFNARLLEEGLCQRGKATRAEDKEPPKPIGTQMLANFTERFSGSEIETLFNAIIRALAKFGSLGNKITAIIDASDLETTAKFQGCGSVTRIKKQLNKRNQIEEIEVTIYGFKLIAIIDLKTQIPLAVKVVKINEHEVTFTLELLKQAQENLKGYATIDKFIFDRGFLDGQDLYKIDQMGITFVLPVKKNMDIYKDARQLALTGDGIKRTRCLTVTRKKSAGGNQEELNTTVVGISSLQTFDSYCPPEMLKHKNSKSFLPEALNAVVVLEWNNIKYGLDKGVVYVTNASIKDPFKTFDLYDNRSIIENLLFRENKQGWHLQKSPKKTASAMTAHAILTMLTFALTLAYRDWKDEEERVEEEAYRSFEFGIRRWRRKISAENQDYVIVFTDDYYAILHVAELTVLAGISVKKAPEGMRTKKEIYARRGLSYTLK